MHRQMSIVVQRSALQVYRIEMGDTKWFRSDVIYVTLWQERFDSLFSNSHAILNEAVTKNSYCSKDIHPWPHNSADGGDEESITKKLRERCWDDIYHVYSIAAKPIVGVGLGSNNTKRTRAARISLAAALMTNLHDEGDWMRRNHIVVCGDPRKKALPESNTRHLLYASHPKPKPLCAVDPKPKPPEPWLLVYDFAEKKHYYYHPQTSKMQWTMPEALASAVRPWRQPPTPPQPPQPFYKKRKRDASR